MKKCIAFQSIVLCGIAMVQVSAMEVKQDPTVPDGAICHLLSMPVDILNYIIRWLWESEKEFIARAIVEKTAPKKYDAYFPFEHPRCHAWPDGFKTIFCPDETKIALFELVCATCFEPKLIIIDIKNEREEDTMYDGYLDKGCCRTMGLSSLGHMVALLQKQKIGTHNSSAVTKKDFLVIKKMVTGETRKFDIPDCFMPRVLAFNKQGTHVLMYGDDVKNELESVKKHIIFSLKNSELKPDHAIAGQQHLLQDYCRHNRICKSIAISR